MSQQSNIEMQGCLGVYVNDSSVISFQLGEREMGRMPCSVTELYLLIRWYWKDR